MEAQILFRKPWYSKFFSFKHYSDEEYGYTWNDVVLCFGPLQFRWRSHLRKIQDHDQK